jgi:ABC-type bacteriocin/lantibiotic exporter with double-glycine peptidase domain
MLASSASAAGSGDLLRVLEILAERVGAEFDPQRGWSALEETAREMDRGADWTLTLAHAAAAVGVRALAGRHVLDEVATQVGPRTPALTLLGSTPRGGRWLIVTEVRGGRFDGLMIEAGDERPVRLKRRALLRALDQPDEAAQSTWVFATPALPLDALHARRIGGEDDPAKQALRRLRALLRLERDDLWVVIVYAIGIGALTLASPIAVQALVNTVAFGALLQPLFVLTLLLVAGLSFAALLKGLAAQVVEVLQQRLFVRAVADIARRLPRVDIGRHDGPELVNRFLDVVTVQKAGAALLLDGVSVALQAAVGMLLLAFYHPTLLAFDLVLLTCLAAVVLIPMRQAIRTSLGESTRKYETVAWLEEVARNPTLFKSEAGMHHAVARAEVLARSYLVARRAHFSRLIVQLVGGLGLQVLASAALLGVGGLLVLERQLTLGQLVAAELVVSAVAASFAKLGKHLETLYDLLAALQKLGKLVDLPLEGAGAIRAFAAGPARLRLRGVSHAIEPWRPALVDFSAEIAAGDRVLLVGDSVGKSDLLDLCFGLRLPDRGQIDVDGVDLRRADLAALRGQIALVRPGDLFAASILDNLRLNAPTASPAALRIALSLVDLDDAVAMLPAGLDTPLRPGGAPLSGTQARRLVLARALAAQPRLLLIDGTLDRLELPPAKLEALFEHLFAPDAPWTLIVVSDDPEVMARCTRTLTIAGHLP